MSRTLEDRDITTQLVHAGERQPPPRGLPVSTPIYATSTFTYGSMAEVDRVFSGAEEEGIVDTYVYYLRRKLDRKLIRTVRGLGYRSGRR